MFLVELNKFSGTEFRNKHLLELYFLILKQANLWKNDTVNSDEIIEFISQNSNQKYTKNDSLYSQRPKMIFDGIKKNIILSEENNLNYIENMNFFEFKNFVLGNLQKNKIHKNFWSKFFNYAENNKNKIVSIKKILLLSLILKENQEIESFYAVDDKKLILETTRNIIIKNKIFEKFEKAKKTLKIHPTVFGFRKKPKTYYEIIELFFYDLIENPKNFKNENYYERKIKTIRIKKREAIEYFDHIRKNLKNSNNILRDWVFYTTHYRIINLIKEYSNINKIWFENFGLLSKIKNNKIKLSDIIDRLEKLDGIFFLKNISDNFSFPFSKSKIISALQKGSANLNDEYKFLTKRKTDILDKTTIKTFIISEYLVNLYFAYEFGISPQEFRKFCRTILNDELLPIYFAPSRGGDMEIIKDKLGIVIETTLITNYQSLLRRETFSNLFHIVNFLNKNNLKKGELYIILNDQISDEVYQQYQKVVNALVNFTLFKHNITISVFFKKITELL